LAFSPITKISQPLYNGLTKKLIYKRKIVIRILRIKQRRKSMNRKNNFQVALLTVVIAAAGPLIWSAPAYSETEGMDRRDSRRDDRGAGRDIRQEGRDVGREAKDQCKDADESRSECRQLKRETKQEAREGARDVKTND
jgi:hypothetical protein